jgi:hypothetical protein
MARAPIVLVVTALLAACGPAAQVGAEPAATASATVETSCTAPGGLAVTPSEERTPGFESGTQLMLERDRRAVAAYGRDHPDQFAGVWFGSEPQRVVAAFTRDVARHCAALLARVDHPDRLEVVRRGSSVVERRLTGREIVPLLRDDPRVVSFGTGADAITVDLRVDAEDLAAELVDRFGDAVALTVGGAPYPPSKIPPSLRCPPLEIQPWPAGVRAILELDDHTVAPGSAAGGVVTVINDSDRRFRTVTGVAEVALLFAPGTERQVGHWTGAMQSSGRPVDLAPGRRARIPVLVGLSSCTPRDGYAVPPGDYEARATVGQDADGQRLSEPARIRVIAED